MVEAGRGRGIIRWWGRMCLAWPDWLRIAWQWDREPQVWQWLWLGLQTFGFFVSRIFSRSIHRRGLHSKC